MLAMAMTIFMIKEHKDLGSSGNGIQLDYNRN